MGPLSEGRQEEVITVPSSQDLGEEGGDGAGPNQNFPVFFPRKAALILCFERSYFSNTFCFKVILNRERP